jgi:hypothetical protein
MEPYLMNGFSILEILILLLFLSIMSVVTHNSMSRILEKRTLYRTAQSAETLLQGGYEFSQYHGVQVHLIKDIFNNFLLKSTNLQIYRLPVMNRHIIFHSIVSSLRGVEAIRFSPDGYVTPGRIELHSRNFLCILRISMRGRVRKECLSK